MKQEGISFRWGIPELDHGNVIIPEPIYRFHGALGLRGNAFVLIIQLSAFKYESARGKASPSLQTLADRMGTDRRTVINLVKKLEDQGWLVVKRNPGKNSEYNFESFAKACWELHRETTSEETDTTLASEETDTTTGERIVTRGVKESTPEEQEVQEQEVQEQEPSADPPRTTFPADWYRQNEQDYQEIKGIELNGPEFGPVQRDLKLIYKAGHSPDEVRAFMTALEKSDEEWTGNWIIGTVRMKLAEFKAGKLFSKNGGNSTPGLKRGSDYYEKARKKTNDPRQAMVDYPQHDPSIYDRGRIGGS